MLLLDFFAECHHQSHLDFRLQIFCRSAFCNTKRGRNGHNEPKIGLRHAGHPRSEEEVWRSTEKGNCSSRQHSTDVPAHEIIIQYMLLPLKRSFCIDKFVLLKLEIQSRSASWTQGSLMRKSAVSVLMGTVAESLARGKKTQISNGLTLGQLRPDCPRSAFIPIHIALLQFEWSFSVKQVQLLLAWSLAV